MSRPKSSVILVGLLLILLPALAIVQYRWIGEVSAAERDRLESSVRAASDGFASDFDAELARTAMSFQIREGFPEDGGAVLQRYQSWLEGESYPRLIRSISLIRMSPNASPDFYKLDMRSGSLEPAPLPQQFANLRDRFRPGPLNFSGVAETVTLLVPIFRGGPPFGRPRPEEFGPRDQNNFRPRRPDDFRPRGPGGGPGIAARIEGALVAELDPEILLKEIVPPLVERYFSSADKFGYRVAIAAGADHPQILYSSQGQWTANDMTTPDASVFLFGAPPPQPGEARCGGGRPRGPAPFLRVAFQATMLSQPWALLVKHRAGSLERAVANLSPVTEIDQCDLTTHIDPELPPVLADAPALVQCVQNLLSNALKYGKTSNRAHIEITTEMDARSKEVRLSVTDRGPGIDPADERHLFEAFYRGARVGSNVPGNGLGLHLVKRIMQAQNARVTYNPASEGGARFTLHIPVAQ